MSRPVHLFCQRLARALAFALAPCLVACSSGAGASGDTGARGKRAGKAASSGGAASGIFIATDRGIEEIDARGQILRRLSPTPARRPRFVGDGAMMFMAAGFGELRHLNLDGTRERPAALITADVANQCNAKFPEPWDPARLLFSDIDMVVDKSGSAICMHLTDGSELQSDSGSVWLRVELAENGRGTVEMICGAKPPPADFSCQPRESAAGGKPTGSYSLGKSALMQRASGAEREARAFAGVTFEEVDNSSSGRWAIARATVKRSGDLVRRVLLLDRESGELFPVRAGKWPKPMGKSAWRGLEKGENVSSLVAEESEIRALSMDDLFVVDSLLIAPGRHIVDTKGQFAK